MKKLMHSLILALVFLLVPLSSAWSRFQQGNHVVSVLAGGIDGVGHYDDLSRVGLLTGANYRYYFRNTLSVGVEADYFGFGEQNYSGKEDLTARVFGTGAYLRLDLTPTSDYVSYFTFGPMLNMMELEYTESTENRTETTAKSGFLVVFGFDYNFRNNWIWGVAGRYWDVVGQNLKAIGIHGQLSYRIGKKPPHPDDDYFD